MRYLLSRSGGKPTLHYPYYVDALSVVKQIITMFFSVNPVGFAAANDELVGFVLNRHRRYLSPKYRLFAYYNPSNRFRTMNVAGKLDVNVDTLEVAQMSVFTEISYWPFGYILTLDSPPPDQRPFDITHFSRYEYGQYSVTHVLLPILPPVGPYSGVFDPQEAA